MDSHSPLPYELTEVENLNYTFVCKEGIVYHVYFNPIFNVYPKLVNTYSFSIEPEDNRPHPIDRRIAATVIEILRRFFLKMENAMIMVCDSLDGRQRKRRNLFNRWYQIYNDGTISTLSAEVSEGDYELLLSIYFRHENPNRRQLIQAFNDLLTNDIYEIVI